MHFRVLGSGCIDLLCQKIIQVDVPPMPWREKLSEC